MVLVSELFPLGIPVVVLSVTGAERGRQDLVIVDAGDVVDRISSANVYVHQMAMDPNGDIYIADDLPSPPTLTSHQILRFPGAQGLFVDAI